MRFVLALALLLPVIAHAEGPIPEKRLVIASDFDAKGRDLAQVSCEGFTFNSKKGACFPKAALKGGAAFAGAVTGLMLPRAPEALAQAEARAKRAAFLSVEDLSAAYQQAKGLGVAHVAGAGALPDAADLRQSIAAATPDLARGYAGALANLTDSAADWLDYARMTLDYSRDSEAARDGSTAALNAYLRAKSDAQAAEALSLVALGWERLERGRDTVAALRLADALADGYSELLAEAQAEYGFRVLEHRVDAESATPRFCAVFSEPLAESGVDYATYLKTDSRLAVEATGSELCVAGLAHGARAQMLLREGLPSASGEKLLKDVSLAAYIRDRAPAVRFSGRNYVLARAKDAGLPVETVNTKSLDLKLMRVSDRNVVALMREEYFAQQSSYWGLENLEQNYVETVWQGTAETAMELNRDVTTRLGVQEVTGPLGAGLYVLAATIPDSDPYETAPALQWFVVSDLGMVSYAGTDGLTVVLRGLSDAAGRKGAEVALMSRANTVLATAKTDAEGRVTFPPEVALAKGASAPALVSARDGEDMAYLSLTDPEFDLSDRGVEGLPPAPAMDAYLATDRGAYRAGETIHATALLRDGAGKALSDVPLTAVLLRPDGVEYARNLAEPAGAGGAVIAAPVAADAPRGTWRMDLYADPDAEPLASARILVEDFMPERIDFTLNLPDQPLPQSALPPISIEARYLFGAKGAGLATEGELRLAAATEIKGLEGYRFGRATSPFAPSRSPLQTGPTDAEGKTEAYAEMPALEEPLPLTAEFVLRVSEGSGRPVERRVSRTLMPDTPVLGIKPAFTDAVRSGEEARFTLRAIAPDLSGAAMPVTWQVNRVETEYQWYSIDGSWNWEPVTHRRKVAEGALALPAEGAQISVPVPDGQYELVVSEQGKALGAVAQISFDAGWYLPAGADTPDRLAVALDQPQYRSGEKARVKITAPQEGVALVSVLTNRVVDWRAVELNEGENELTLKVSEDWGTGAYVTATYLRPLAQATGRAPNRALGLAFAKVDPAERALQASFELPQQAQPRGNLPVALKVEGVARGETAFVTIAAVDLGILNLTGFETPDPQGHYFGQRRLGVGLRDLYGKLIDGQAGTPSALRSGGDAAAGLAMKSPPPTEELMAYFSGPLEVAADGYVQTEVPLPAFNGTVRLMAMVWSESGIGQAQADVQVADPVVLTANAPRFLAPQDKAEVVLELHHREGPAGEVKIAAKAEGLTVTGLAPTVQLPAQGRAEIRFAVQAEEGEEAKLTLDLTTPDGKLLRKTLTIPLRRNDPAVARVSRFELAAGESFTFDETVFAGLTGGSATLIAGPLARYNAAGLMAALDGYPYGCTEQMTSKAMPLLYLSSLASALGQEQPAELQAKVETAIRGVLLNQDSEGSFGLWEASGGDFWLDSYVTDFLSRARAEGYAVPDRAFRAAIDNLQNRVNYAGDFSAETSGGGRALAYALMVLAREGVAAIGDLRYYADEKSQDFATSLAAAQLGAALAQVGDQPRADKMFARAAELVSLADDGSLREDYGSPIRDAAAVLTLARASGSTAIDAEALGQSLAGRVSGRLSTQEAMWVLMAAHSEIDRPAPLSVNGVASAQPLLRLKAGESPLTVQNTADAPVDLTVTTLGVEPAPQPALDGYKITRSYFDLEGNPLDIQKVKRGTRMVAVLEVQPFEQEGGRLMVADPLPAGFEIDNPTLLRAGDIAGLDWLESSTETQMTEFREDRFIAAVDHAGEAPIKLAYVLRAITSGSFHHPAASVEDMYRPERRGTSETGMVTVE